MWRFAGSVGAVEIRGRANDESGQVSHAVIPVGFTGLAR